MDINWVNLFFIYRIKQENLQVKKLTVDIIRTY